MGNRWRRWGKCIGLAIACAYLFMIFGVADFMIIMPLPGHIDAGNAHREFVTANGQKIECWVANSAALNDAEPQGYVLEFCGNATRAETIAQYVPYRWRNVPVQTWVMNYPGVGGSDGHVRMANIAPAALGVYDELAKRGKPVFVEGNSLGTISALCVAARRNVAGCLLHDPVPLRQVIVRSYGWWNLWTVAYPVSWRVPGEIDSIANARQVKVPCMFILAEKDDFITPRFHHLIVDAYAGEKKSVLLRNKGHYDSVGPESENEVEQGIAWLWEQRTVKPK